MVKMARREQRTEDREPVSYNHSLASPFLAVHLRLAFLPWYLRLFFFFFFGRVELHGLCWKNEYTAWSAGVCMEQLAGFPAGLMMMLRHPGTA